MGARNELLAAVKKRPLRSIPASALIFIAGLALRLAEDLLGVRRGLVLTARMDRTPNLRGVPRV